MNMKTLSSLVDWAAMNFTIIEGPPTAFYEIPHANPLFPAYRGVFQTLKFSATGTETEATEKLIRHVFDLLQRSLNTLNNAGHQAFLVWRRRPAIVELVSAQIAGTNLDNGRYEASSPARWVFTARLHIPGIDFARYIPEEGASPLRIDEESYTYGFAPTQNGCNSVQQSASTARDPVLAEERDRGSPRD